MTNFLVNIERYFELFKIMHYLKLDSLSTTIDKLIEFYIENNPEVINLIFFN